MAFSNPFSLVIGTDTFVLKRVNQDNYTAEYLYTGTGFEVTMKVRHSYESKKAGVTQVDRHNVDISKTIFNVDGTTTTIQAYLVVRANRGTDPAEVAKYVGALCTVGTAEKLTISNRDLSL